MAAKKIQYSVSMRPNPQHEDDPQKAYASIQLTVFYHHIVTEVRPAAGLLC